MDKIKTPITNAYKAWKKKASKEELQKFCDDANALALLIQKLCKK